MLRKKYRLVKHIQIQNNHEVKTITYFIIYLYKMTKCYYNVESI